MEALLIYLVVLTSANRSRKGNKSKDMLNSSTKPHEFVEGGNVELNYELLLVHLNTTDKPKAKNNQNIGQRFSKPDKAWKGIKIPPQKLGGDGPGN